ncbi:hypothetical protein BKA70DRAFT_1025976, partial [Coprinopsis sp. MPI-PUGE-AT-0042]
LEKLKLAQGYIEDLRNANLEESGLDPAVIAKIRAPVQMLLDLDKDRDLKLAIRLFSSAVGSASQQAYADARSAIMERWPDTTIPTYDQVKTKIQEISGIAPIVHDMCIKSCQAYTGPLAAEERCRECNEGRYEPGRKKKKPRQTFYTIPIAPQVQALWRSKETAALM